MTVFSGRILIVEFPINLRVDFAARIVSVVFLTLEKKKPFLFNLPHLIIIKSK